MEKGEIAQNDQFHFFPRCFQFNLYLKVPIAANQKGVYLQNTSKSHSYHLQIWEFFTLWIGHGAVLKSSSQWQLK